MSKYLRAAIVAEALAWLNTPFHHAARIKGAGVDCVNLLVGVFSARDIVPDLQLESYSHDWHMHRDEPRFLTGLEQYADRIGDGEMPMPGDVAMFNYGRHAAHGAIVINWPVVIHAWRDAGKVVLSEADSGPLAGRLVGFWRLRSFAE